MNASEGRNIQPANFIGFPYLFAIISPLRLDHCLSGLLQCFSGAVAASTWRAYSGHNIWRSHSAHFVQHVLLVGAGCYGAFALVRGGPITAAAQKQDGKEYCSCPSRAAPCLTCERKGAV